MGNLSKRNSGTLASFARSAKQVTERDRGGTAASAPFVAFHSTGAGLLAELDPALGGNSADLLPYADTGTDFPTDGVARTILPNDNKHGRWESNLDAVIVNDVPEPATLALLAFALPALGIARHRRFRQGPVME